MTAFATLDGVPVLRGTLALPRRGAWSASLVLDTDTPPTGAVTLVTDEGAVTYRGTVVRAREVYGRVEVLLVGGAGRLATVLPPRRYLTTPARLVWQDLLSEAGEAASATSDATLLATQLPSWTRLRGQAGDALARLGAALGAAWRVRLDGTVQLTAAEASEATSRQGDQQLDAQPADASALYALARLDLEPGQLLDGRRVSHLVHEIDAGSIRSKVWFDG